MSFLNKTLKTLPKNNDVTWRLERKTKKKKPQRGGFIPISLFIPGRMGKMMRREQRKVYRR